MKSALGNAAKQMGGLAKHVAKQIVKAPFEIVKGSNGKKADQGQENNKAMEQMEQGAAQAQQGGAQDDGSFTGFATKQHFQKYAKKTDKRDEILLRQARRQLQKEFGVGEGVEAGVAKARMERAQKQQREEQVGEQQKEQKKGFVAEKKKENAQVAMAKGQTGAETKVGKKVMG